MAEKADKHGRQTQRHNPDEKFTPTWNPFNLEQPKGIITNGAILEKHEEDCLMNCISLGKAADEFYESCLTEKSIQLLETIPKTRKSTKKMNERK